MNPAPKQAARSATKPTRITGMNHTDLFFHTHSFLRRSVSSLQVVSFALSSLFSFPSNPILISHSSQNESRPRSNLHYPAHRQEVYAHDVFRHLTHLSNGIEENFRVLPRHQVSRSHRVLKRQQRVPPRIGELYELVPFSLVYIPPFLL